MWGRDKGERVMKYIRTKDEIYEIDNNKYSVVELNGHQLLNMKVDNKGLIYREYILKQSDTIEELCDEFVMIGNHDHYISEKKFVWFEGIKIYGAIWTDRGLIYVAKMNDKGELELI